MAQEYKQLYLDFDQYIRQGEAGQKERAQAWRTAIGLQAVDGLKTSEYLQQTALRNIEGEITIDQARNLVKQYYVTKTAHDTSGEDNEEADKVSANIAKILSSDTLDFSANGFISLHRRIFDGVFKHAGKIRDYNISKREWVLEGDSVSYLNWEDLRRALEYDIEQERSFNYKGLSQDKMISHIASFVSGLWQIHAFGEGNTRTTAVFTIQYLRSVGFDIDNNLFANHSWYFRNALVRANYKNLVKGIDYTPVYLERFFRNLLLGEQWDLRNRYLHIHPTTEWSLQPNLATPTSTPSSTPSRSFATNNTNIIRLVKAIGQDQLSVREILMKVGLKDRENFLDYSLRPAVSERLVQALYPDKPHHPRQKYLLTAKGLMLLESLEAE